VSQEPSHGRTECEEVARTNFFRALAVALSAALAASLLTLVGSPVVLVEAQPTTLPRQGGE
jgi:hypothetical protein